MRRGHCTRVRIGEQQRYTIGALNGDGKAPIIGDDDVGGDGLTICRRQDHGVAVDLPRATQRVDIKIEGPYDLLPGGAVVGRCCA